MGRMMKDISGVQAVELLLVHRPSNSYLGAQEGRDIGVGFLTGATDFIFSMTSRPDVASLMKSIPEALSMGCEATGE
jgi:hypothetical protein